MFFKIFFTFFILFSQNLICAADAFESTLDGVKYCRYERAYYIFDDTMYGVESEKYARLQGLLPKEMEYADSIDYSHTHLLAEKGIAIVTHDSEINQVATGFIHDCVGVVIRQVNEDGSICKTLVAHGCEHSTYAPPGQQPHDDFNDLTSIVDGFLAGITPHAVKIDFVTTYNTDHLLDLYHHGISKGILKSNITLTGNFPGDKRPIRKVIGCHEITYFPTEYSVVALKSPPPAADFDPITEDFWCSYLNGMSLFVDISGNVFPKIKDYLKDAGLTGRAPTLLDHHSHVRLGLSLGISRNAYFPVPNTKQACEAELARLVVPPSES